MSALRSATVAALLASSTQAFAATELQPIPGAEWMCEVIIWIAETFGPNIPTEVEAEVSAAVDVPDGPATAYLHSWAGDADAWSTAFLELEDGGYAIIDEKVGMSLAASISVAMGTTMHGLAAYTVEPTCSGGCDWAPDYEEGDRLLVVETERGVAFFDVLVD